VKTVLRAIPVILALVATTSVALWLRASPSFDLKARLETPSVGRNDAGGSRDGRRHARLEETASVNRCSRSGLGMRHVGILPIT